MKKIIKLIMALVIIVFLGIYLKSKGYLDFSKYLPNEKIKNEDIVVNALQSDNSVYYYNKLSNHQKGLYNKILYGISKLDKTVALNINTDDSYEKISEEVANVFEYILADHPEIWYLKSGYQINVNSIAGINVVKVGLEYNVDSKLDLEKQTTIMLLKINEIISKNIKEEMSDYEKELAIHDYLALNINYYKFEDINNIPDIKHSAYGALIDKNAVCDGITKGYQLILNKLDIENILVKGTLENVSHAWNLVKLDEKYYHVDLTSDTTLLKTKKQKPVHVYFNITDLDILETHEIEAREFLPVSNSVKYNYYKYENKEINSLDDFETKLETIILNNEKKEILELKITDVYNPSEKLVNGLYKLNYNNIKINRQKNISYIKAINVFVFANI